MTHASAYGVLEKAYHVSKVIINCVTCKYKMKILGGAPAPSAPVVPTPLYRKRSVRWFQGNMDAILVMDWYQR